MDHAIHRSERSLHLRSALAGVIRSLGLPIKMVVGKEGRVFFIREVREISDVGHNAVSAAYHPEDRIRIGRLRES